MKRIIFFLVLLLSLTHAICTAQPRERKMYVFCVGVGDYADPRIHDLTKPPHDADTIAAFFRKGDNEVMVLKDSEATGKNIRKCMKTFFSQVKKNDVIVFFFSGHGIKSGFCAQDYFQAEGGALYYDDIKEIFHNVEAHGKIILADACYSGKLRSKQDTVNKPTLTTGNNQQIMLFLSSRGEEVSYESPSMQNGYFTTYLVEALRGAADANNNGNITAMELSNYVSTKLRRALGNQQHSVMWGKFNKGWIISKLPKKADDATPPANTTMPSEENTAPINQ